MSARFDSDILPLIEHIVSYLGFVLVLQAGFFSLKVKATEREKQEEERSQTQNEENRHATRHQVH